MNDKVPGSAAMKLESAMERLIQGRPLVTDGALTKNNLFREAGVSRATMNRAKALLTEWDHRVRTVNGTQEVGLDAKTPSNQLNNDVALLRNEVAALRTRLAAAATVITVLHAENEELREAVTAQRTSRMAGLPSRRGTTQEASDRRDLNC